MNTELDHLKYPIGKFSKPETFNEASRNECVAYTAKFPMLLMSEVKQLNEKQLDTQYREGGWTIRQVVHHCADSHMNALIRFKLTLTEENPTIRPYIEASWALLPDSKMPIESSLNIIDGVHAHLAVLWASLNNSDLEKKYIHPQYQAEYSLAHAMALYDWHARHHLAHITSLKKRMHW